MDLLSLSEVDETQGEMIFLSMEYKVSGKSSDSSGWTEEINPFGFVSHHTHIRHMSRGGPESTSTLKVKTLNFS